LANDCCLKAASATLPAILFGPSKEHKLLNQIAICEGLIKTICKCPSWWICHSNPPASCFKTWTLFNLSWQVQAILRFRLRSLRNAYMKHEICEKVSWQTFLWRFRCRP
jgi:hypothetical protein